MALMVSIERLETMSLSDLTNAVIQIDVSIKQAKKMLVDMEWIGDEEACKSLRNEIERLEKQKALGETHDVPW